MPALAYAVILQLASTPACSVPGMTPAFWPTVVKAESSYDPLALHDDTTSQSYHPESADAAEALANKLMAAGHSVGVGLGQLTASSRQEFWNKFGLTIRDALDACKNMQAGARFYVDRALRIYHTGSPDRGAQYAANIIASGQSQPAARPATLPPIKVNRHASDTEAW